MAKEKPKYAKDTGVRVERKPKHLYYVDKEGRVMEAPLCGRGGKPRN